MGFWSKIFTWWNGATVGTSLFTRRFGDGVGRDEFGNSISGTRRTRPPLGDLCRRQ